MSKKLTPFPFKTIGLLVILLGLLGIRCSSPSAGTPAPDFQSKLMDGSDFNLKQLRGNYVLLDFWASWCGPCRKDFPHMAALNEDFKDATFEDASGFKIVSVALEKNDKPLEELITKYNLNWKYHIKEVTKFVRFSDIASKYNVTDIPSKFLIDPNGNLVGQFSEVSEIRSYLLPKRK